VLGASTLLTGSKDVPSFPARTENVVVVGPCVVRVVEVVRPRRLRAGVFVPRRVLRASRGAGRFVGTDETQPYEIFTALVQVRSSFTGNPL
jgi:hypothetical protein